MSKRKKSIVYRVSYHTLEPSYYENSEKVYVDKKFTKIREALDFAEEVKKWHPEQIMVTKLTEETVLDWRQSDEWRNNG